MHHIKVWDGDWDKLPLEMEYRCYTFLNFFFAKILFLDQVVLAAIASVKFEQSLKFNHWLVYSQL